MKFKKSMVGLLVLATMPLVACQGTTSSSSTSSSSSSSAPTSSSSSATSSSAPEEKVTLNMSVMYQKLDTRMKFRTGYGALKSASSYTGADGVTYEDGDFKPVWAALQKNLNFTINDVTSDTDLKIADAFTTLKTNGFKAGNDYVNIAQGSSADIISEGTTNNTILNLADYLGYMPNFKKFLADNPVVKKTIVDSNGAIYYAPYFDGFDDVERMLMLRKDWVEMLLDGDLPTTLDTAKTITKSYEAYGPSSIDTTIKVMNTAMDGSTTVAKKYSAGNNVITQQNALATMNGTSLVKCLRDYIDTTYNKAYGTKRSDLFCGANSAYDIDELVALYRCVKACPNFLTGDGNKDIVPFFPRASTNDRTADLWRFLQFFGVRGLESRNGYLYVAKDGTIVDARGQESTRNGLKKLNEMYKEGLILENFTTKGEVTANSEDFRGGLLQKDRGFSTYDYNQTTTIYNDDKTCKTLNGGKFLFTSVLPAVADWRGDGTYFHYTESWRSVKTEGWFITSKTAEDSKALAKALSLFDYLYSDEGNRLMSYGPDGYLAKNADGSIKTMAYQGKQVPVLSDDCKSELATLASGNYTNYYRYWIGATYPVGYIKQQGMEYQTVSSKALAGLDLVNNAIATGVLEHVNFKTGNEDKLYSIIPTTFAFSETEQNNLSANYKDLDAAINNTKGKTNVWSTIVMSGFGDVGGVDYSFDNYLTIVNSTLKLNGYVLLYNAAYSRMGL